MFRYRRKPKRQKGGVAHAPSRKAGDQRFITRTIEAESECYDVEGWTECPCPDCATRWHWHHVTVSTDRYFALRVLTENRGKYQALGVWMWAEVWVARMRHVRTHIGHYQATVAVRS